jgi:hypothetical protein
MDYYVILRCAICNHDYDCCQIHLALIVSGEHLRVCGPWWPELAQCQWSSYFKTFVSDLNAAMGYMLPSPDSPSERARSLIARKDALEAELEAQGSILKANNTDMRQSLVDREGFPRDDLDVWAVRHARVRIIELRNDLAALMDEIAKTLETVYRRSPPPQVESDRSGATTAASATVSGETTTSELLPFARVNGVAPGSPAADAVRPSFMSLRCGSVSFCDLKHLHVLGYAKRGPCCKIRWATTPTTKLTSSRCRCRRK